jgi:lipopolysaccharide transport system permease protein
MARHDTGMDTTTSGGAVSPAARATPGAPSQTSTPARPAPTQSHTHPLPEEPLVTIEPGGAWGALDLRELWLYRELLYFLIWRDVKVRYKQAALGMGWVVLQPLLTTLIFTVFLGGLARVPSDGAPYLLFVYLGLLPWNFFSSAVNISGQSLVGNANLITKVYFPRVLIPMAAVGARFVDLGVSLVILAALMLYYGVAPTAGLLLMPLPIALAALLALACGMLAAALNVRYRDVGAVLPVLIQLCMYVSPVLYPVSMVPERWRGLYSLNPLVGIIEGFRASVLGRPFDRQSLAVSALFTVVLLVCSPFLFRRAEKGFADVI